MVSPLSWLKFEELRLPKQVRVSFVLHYTIVESLWKQGYDLGRLYRETGMSWAKIEECVKKVAKMVDSTYWNQHDDTDFDDWSEFDLDDY